MGATVHVLDSDAGKRARIASSAPGECSTSDTAAQQLERELEHALRDFVRLKTVSCDPTLREDCFRGAKFLATLLESLGGDPPSAPPILPPSPVQHAPPCSRVSASLGCALHAHLPLEELQL